MTTDDDDYIDLDAEENAASGKKKKGEGDKTGTARGRETAQISEAAQVLMQSRGLSLTQIKEVIRTWRHLDSKEIAVRLAEFGKDVAKASAHILVNFTANTKDAGFAVMGQFLKQCDRLAQMAHKMNPKARQSLQQKHRVDLG